MTTGIEQHEFQTETRQILDLMIHSVYSNKDTFLRELVSNSSDALDKLKLEAFRDKDLEADVSDLHIELVPDTEARTLTVRDNGIGMSRDEVIDLIGTLAKSGTNELRHKLREAQDAAASEALIGQFGIGFYSTFMVADRVTLLTRKAGEKHATRWESSGDATYTIETVDDAPQGTSVTLHLKPVDTDDHMHDYTAASTLREIVKRYSDFISYPVRMQVEDATEALNSMKALWARPRSEVTDEEYNEFYKHVSHSWDDPLEIVPMKAEGTFEYQALLFVPSHAPFDLFSREHRSGIHLYVKRVFIMDDCAELMPEYLRFVTGVVDAQDLSLNVSREILQQDRQIRAIRRRLTKKVLTTIRDLQSSDDKQTRDKYTTLWSQFGRVLKEGLLSDFDNRELLLEISSFPSTHSEDEQTTLAQYVERMPDGQDQIYFLTGESRQQLESSPHMEAFRARGLEVLLLTDPVDEMWVTSVPEFDGRPLQSIAQGEVELGTDEEKKEAEAQREEQGKEFADVLAWLTTTLDDHVKQVRLSTRLTDSPACIVGDEFGMTPALERMYRASGQQVPHFKRILELNPTHPLVEGLRAAHADRSDDPSLAETAELLYGTALLAEGGELEDPAHFAKLLANRLARTV
ncbi:molecular chaperone HtpG [Prescottella subtropica]|uniref:molecular chaperone HtpG n=1 Tax=Prescottella subtropica TaxID=2545757 RepID=UPI0010FA06A2|nr:molecular chaperone HtpG [Prescottella subtropica]